MNHSDIYRKTLAGEEAMTHRAKAEERQLRLVLVLIDGKTSIGKVSEKIGDDAFTQSAVAILAANGLIALAPASAPSPADAPIESGPIEAARASQTMPTVFTPSPADAARTAHLMSVENFALPSINDANLPVPAHKEVEINVEPEPTEEEKEKRRQLRARRLRRVFSVLGGILLFFFVGFAIIYMYSYSAERTALEKWLSQGLGAPVRVGQVSPVLLPRPALELRQIQIGDAPGQNRIDLIRLPGLFSRLFGLSFNADDRVDIFGGSLDAVLLSTWRGGATPGGMTNVRLRQLEIHLGEYALATFDGDILFAQNGALQRANLRSKPLQLEITAQDKAAAYTVMVRSVDGWRPVQDLPLQIQSLSGAMQIYPDRLRLEKGKMHLLGGDYEGDLELSWLNGKVRAMNGEGVLSNIRIASLLNDAGFTKSTTATDATLKLEGDISGALRFHTSGDTPELWRKNLEAHGEMKVERSILRGIDLIRLMRSGSKGKIFRRNGLTRFSKLNFDVDVNSDGLKLDKLRLNATSLHGEGEVSIDAEGELSGKIKLLMFNGEGGAGSELLLNGRYPLLETELRGAS
jgi:hypothetical protein